MVGLGRMGAGMTERLRQAGHEVQTYDPNVESTASSLAELAGQLEPPRHAWMMVPGWIKYTTKPEDTGVALKHMVDHIDHVCQLAGNSLHSGIGTDLDGGFGREQAPMDLETIADLQKVPSMLAAACCPFGRRGVTDNAVSTALLPRRRTV